MDSNYMQKMHLISYFKLNGRGYKNSFHNIQQWHTEYNLISDDWERWCVATLLLL